MANMNRLIHIHIHRFDQRSKRNYLLIVHLFDKIILSRVKIPNNNLFKLNNVTRSANRASE